MAINILIIDDDKRALTHLISNLKRADVGNALGVIEIDDSIVQLDTVEKYDVSKYDTTFDVALIDYQLTSSFTGILFSAWIALYLKIPRIALTTAAYPGDPNYFNGSILKREITDTPNDVIQRIINCVETYNSDAWLNEQHRLLVEQYQSLLRTNDNSLALAQLENLLDSFERILDAQQEAVIKKASAFEQYAAEQQKKAQSFDQRFEELYAKLQKYQEEIGLD